MLTESSIRRLVLAKAVFVHGKKHAVQKDRVSRMLAIHHFDSSIEVILRILADASGRKYDQYHFNKIHRAAEQAFQDKTQPKVALPQSTEIAELHKIRNQIQHAATVPDTETVKRFEDATEVFLKEVLDKFFGVSLASLSLASLLSDQKLHDLLDKAQQHFERQEFKDCIRACDEALIRATFETGDIVSKAGLLTGYWGAGILSRMFSDDYAKKYKGASRRLAEDTGKALLELGKASTTMQFLDAYRVDFLRHRQAVSNLDKLAEGELMENAESSLEFVTGLLLKWQEEGIL